MNLPLRRRLAGRKTRPGCPGEPEQVTATDREAEHAAYMSWVAATVEEHGWAVTGRHGDEAAPPWAYSVGMWVSCQLPELVLCGLPVAEGAAVINAIGARASGGARLAAGDVLDGAVLGAVPGPAGLALRPVEQSWRASDGLLGISNAFYGMVRPPYLQVVWSDRDGRFPGEPGCRPGLDRRQPLLWLPRDDNPPSAWTRLDRLG